ncbi:MAG: hypothetical protein PVG13_07025 [Thiohalophilus sp.]|jgi:hypothetical protein
MKKIIMILLCSLSITAVPVFAQADEQSIVGIIAGVDMNKRLLYIDGESYTLAKDAKLSSSKTKIYYDASNLKAGTVATYTWTTYKDKRIITALYVHEGLQDVPE